MSSPETKDEFEDMGPLERLSKNGYALRLLENLLIHKELEYKEGEISGCFNIPKDQVDHAIRTLIDEYHFINVSGNSPNRVVKLKESKEVNYLDKLQYTLANQENLSYSIKSGYDNAQEFT